MFGKNTHTQNCWVPAQGSNGECPKTKELAPHHRATRPQRADSTCQCALHFKKIKMKCRKKFCCTDDLKSTPRKAKRPTMQESQPHRPTGPTLATSRHIHQMQSVWKTEKGILSNRVLQKYNRDSFGTSCNSQQKIPKFLWFSHGNLRETDTSLLKIKKTRKIPFPHWEI